MPLEFLNMFWWYWRRGYSPPQTDGSYSHPLGPLVAATLQNYSTHSPTPTLPQGFFYHQTFNHHTLSRWKTSFQTPFLLPSRSARPHVGTCPEGKRLAAPSSYPNHMLGANNELHRLVIEPSQRSACLPISRVRLPWERSELRSLLQPGKTFEAQVLDEAGSFTQKHSAVPMPGLLVMWTMATSFLATKKRR